MCRIATLLALIATFAHLPAEDGDRRAAAKAELAKVAPQAQALSRAFELVHEIVGASVLSIHTSRTEAVYYARGWNIYKSAQEVPAGEGSGFVFATDDKFSYVLTNSHVVLQTEDASPAKFDHVTAVLNDGREVAAQYVAWDLATDLAVMKLPLAGLPTVDWANSDQARVGDWVVALGYPLGVGYSATAGIVSATDRSTRIYESVNGFESFIQTDAAINRGNSGGPLVTIEGRVVGVNASILSPTGNSIGIGFAIPSNLARRVAEDLVAHGRVTRPQIGVYLDELKSDEATALGLPPRPTVVVKDLVPGSPADVGGVKRKDAILAVNGVAIASLQQFRARVAALRIEDPIDVTVWRDGKDQNLRLTPVSEDQLEELAKRAADAHRGVRLAGFGMTLAVDDKPGLVIAAVAPGELAEQAKLGEGDRLLVERDLGELNTLEDARALAGKRELVLQVLAKGRSKWIKLRR